MESVTVCAQADGPGATETDLTVLWISLMSLFTKDEIPLVWKGVRNERPTALRPAYFQFPLQNGMSEAEFLALRGRLPKGLAGFRLALVNERGEVVRTDP